MISHDEIGRESKNDYCNTCVVASLPPPPTATTVHTTERRTPKRVFVAFVISPRIPKARYPRNAQSNTHTLSFTYL